MDTKNNEMFTGCVKWFNKKQGFGFIHVKSKPNTCITEDTDIFVHHSSIQASNQYKYLVQGEYVEFHLEMLEPKPNNGHKYQATQVTGIGRGNLMCDTRQMSRKK